MNLHASAGRKASAHGPTKSTVRKSRSRTRAAMLGIACGLSCAAVGQAAIEAKLHEVSTSVGLAPINATNVWKLETDPVFDDSTLADYIPSDGLLDNSFDPTKFKLAVSPYTNTYALGYTVQGLGAYQVISFQVQLTTGYIQVTQDPKNLANSIDTGMNGASGPETGVIDQIHFSLIPSSVNLALPANQDQLFFRDYLVPINPGPDFTPGAGTVFPDATSYVTIIPADPTDTVDMPITTYNEPSIGEYIDSNSTVPEPSLSGTLVAGSIGLLVARRPDRSQG